MEENNNPYEPMTPWEGNPTPGKKKSKALKGIIIGVAAVVVVAAAAVAFLKFGPTGGGSPLAKVAKGFSNTAESIKKNPVVSLMDGIGKGGSVELSMGLEDLTEEALGVPIDADASLKLYQNASSGMALVADVSVDGSSFLDATMILGKDDFVVSSDVLYGRTSYGINLKTIAKDFDKSVFGPNGEYSADISGKDLQKILDTVKNTGTLPENAKNATKKATEALMKSVAAHAHITTGNENLAFGGTEVKTTAVTVTVDAIGAINIAKDMVSFLRTDPDVKAFLEDNANIIYMYVYENLDIYYGIEDSDEMIDWIYDSLEDLEETMDEVLEDADTDDAPDVELSCTFYVSKSGNLLVGMNAILVNEDEEIGLSIYAGPDFEKLEEIRIQIDAEGETAKATYTVKERSRDAYSADLVIRADGESLKGKIDWDKKDGDLELEFSDKGSSSSLGLTGSMFAKGPETAITIESVYVDDEELDLGVDIVLNTSDKMPSVPEYINILAMDIDELEEMLQETVITLQDAVYSLAYSY